MIVEGGEGGWVGEDIGHCLGTPEVSVFDGRGLRIGRVEYNRRTAAEALRRVWERHEYDASGRMVASRDGRLGAVKGGTANLAVAYSLSGRIVRRDSVDNGVRVSLADVSGAEVLSLDGRGSWRRTQYDVLARPVSLHEGGCDEGEGEAGPSRCMLVADAPASGTPWQEAASHGGRCVERIVYGMGGEAATRNQCGRILCHDDAGGRRRMQGYALSGAVLLETQRFVRAEVLALGGPDWPRDAGEGDGLLDDSCHTSAWSYDALGGEVTMTDAAGHVRRTAYDVAGQVRTRGLKLAGQDKEQIVAGGFVYGADGKLEKEQAGNGVATHYVYAAATRRLMGAMTVREGDGRVLADRTYTYDPVGNILAIEDKAQSVHYGRNRQIAPVWRHRYDARYQLIETFGRESVQAGLDERLPQALRLRVGDAGQLVPYRRSYHYDAGGNLTELAHAGAHSYTQRFVVSSCSNRTLPQMDGLTAAAVAAGFDANGNLHDLAPGQALSWDARNQLQKVVLVGRGDAEADDAETYVYDGGGRRLIKTRTFLTAPGQHSEQVRYLPGLELRTNSQTGEVLQVVEAGDRLRVLVWQAGKPKAIASPQWRYSLTDHLGSLHLELDAEALLISREEYYPHGGTAVWTTRSHVEAPYKHRRHAGKERDASGLYYYGLRYLSPGSHQRWINPDPANEIDGLNLYWFCRNNPVTLTDELGLAPEAGSGWGQWTRRIAASVYTGVRDAVVVGTASVAGAFIRAGMEAMIEEPASDWLGNIIGGMLSIVSAAAVGAMALGGAHRRMAMGAAAGAGVATASLLVFAYYGHASNAANWQGTGGAQIAALFTGIFRSFLQPLANRMGGSVTVPPSSIGATLESVAVAFGAGMAGRSVASSVGAFWRPVITAAAQEGALSAGTALTRSRREGAEVQPYSWPNITGYFRDVIASLPLANLNSTLGRITTVTLEGRDIATNAIRSIGTAFSGMRYFFSQRMNRTVKERAGLDLNSGDATPTSAVMPLSMRARRDSAGSIQVAITG